jgi:hypothetical protein
MNELRDRLVTSSGSKEGKRGSKGWSAWVAVRLLWSQMSGRKLLLSGMLRPYWRL